MCVVTHELVTEIEIWMINLYKWITNFYKLSMIIVPLYSTTDFQKSSILEIHLPVMVDLWDPTNE